jgi:hypothetical protein
MTTAALKLNAKSASGTKCSVTSNARVLPDDFSSDMNASRGVKMLDEMGVTDPENMSGSRVL